MFGILSLDRPVCWIYLKGKSLEVEMKTHRGIRNTINISYINCVNCTLGVMSGQVAIEPL